MSSSVPAPRNAFVSITCTTLAESVPLGLTMCPHLLLLLLLCGEKIFQRAFWEKCISDSHALRIFPLCIPIKSGMYCSIRYSKKLSYIESGYLFSFHFCFQIIHSNHVRSHTLLSIAQFRNSYS